MFSESSDSSDEGPGAAGEESDAGEKELIRQEKLERSRKRKRQEQRMTGFITKKGLPAGKIGPERATEDRLEKNRQKRAKVSAFQTPEVVRSSTRAHTVKNKKYVLQRLQENERRKATNPVHHQPKAKELLTQAERIQRAKLIEERNVASLNEFFEQEVMRKKTQRAAMFAQRLIELGPLIRWRSVQTNLPAGQRRLIVEEIEQNEKVDGRKRAWRKHLTENDDEKLEGVKPEKRKYNKKAKLAAGADADSAPDSNQKATGGPPGETEKLDGSAGEPAPSQTYPNLPSSTTKAQDTTPRKTDMDNDRGHRDDSQQTDVQEVGPAELMSSPARAPGLSPIRQLPAADTDTKSHDLIESDTNPRDARELVNGEVNGANEPRSITTGEDDCESRAPATVNMLDDVLDGLEKKTEYVPIVESFGDKIHPDVGSLQAGISPVDGRLLTEETTPEPTVLPVELVPCSTELVSLMDFPSDQKLDASTVRSVLLGSQASSGRAPARAKRHLCPITGGAVRFKDPLTGVCYSSLESFKVVRKVLSGDMPWNSAFGDGMYYGKDDDVPEWLFPKVDEHPQASIEAPTDREL
ncbi:YL1 nuclear protein-domain-containing protein [Lipomyces kononenkoae]